MSFPDPIPRVATLRYSQFTWPVESSIALPIPASIDSAWPSLQTRRTQRDFGPASLERMSALLWHTARCQETEASDLGFELQFRPVPSAGAIHPIHILMEHELDRWARYDPLAHQLQLLDLKIDLQGLRTGAAEVVDPKQGRLMAFIAEPGMTRAKYEHCESLVWRDAGVAQGGLALVAAQLELSLCLLGLTGHETVSQLGNEGQLWGVGMAIVGST